MNRTLLSLIVRTLRDPRELIDEADERDTLSWAVPRLLGLTLLGGAVFGAVIGGYRGGLQVPFAALKMPLLLTIPLVIGLPTVRALFATPEQTPSWSRVAFAGLVGSARAGILAAAASPILWLLWSVVLDYHQATVVLSLAVMAVGLQSLLTMRFALPELGVKHLGAVAVSTLILGLTTAQTGWVLRPFIARPTAEITFLRPLEADIGTALLRSTRSAAGDYGSRSWEPQSAGLGARGLRRSSPSRQDGE